MTEKYVVPCLVDEEKCDSCIEIEENDTCRIIFRFQELELISESENYFFALIDLRKDLESRGIKLLCQGCAKNVYPSPMILEMGDAIRAYKLTWGKRAKLSELVDIFTPCEQEDYASIEEQAEYYKNWINGPKE